MPSLELDSVPESHAWSDIDNHPSADATGDDAFPVIDLSAPNAAHLVGLACESWGVFQVVGHGIPDHFIEKLDYQARRFFALPTEEKMKTAMAPGTGHGYGSVPIASFFSKQFWSEGFGMKGSPCDLVSKIWPQDSTFSNVIEDYRKEMKELCQKLLTMMLQSLGLTEADIARGDPLGLTQMDLGHHLQLNWYPACPEPDRAMGMGDHTDTAILAVLLCDSTSGLQVLRVEDEHGPNRWVTVPPLPGAFVVNVGDLGHIMSNGRFRSVVHRAIVNKERARLSVVYFWYPPDHVTVVPVVGGPNTRTMYRAVTWPEYLAIKWKIFDKALSSIKLAEEKELQNDSSLARCAEEETV